VDAKSVSDERERAQWGWWAVKRELSDRRFVGWSSPEGPFVSSMVLK